MSDTGTASPRPVRNAERVIDDVFVTISRKVMLRTAAKTAGGGAYRVYAGYAGWMAGQLEREISEMLKEMKAKGKDLPKPPPTPKR